MLDVLMHYQAYFTDPQLWTNIVFNAFKIIAIFIASQVIIRMSTKAIDHMMRERDHNPLKLDRRRTQTIGRLIGNIVTYVVGFITILLILSQIGFNLAPLLAGAGVLGLAIGFGAQSLVKDVISGFFIIFEDQFSVGDVVQIGTYKGTVEEIGLRVTRMRSWTGEVHIIPNGSIVQVTNFSIYNALAVIDVSIAYQADIDRALHIMRKTVKELPEQVEDLIGEPQVLGVHNIGAEIVIRVTAECKPNTQADVSRIIRAELKRALDADMIEIKTPAAT